MIRLDKHREGGRCANVPKRALCHPGNASQIWRGVVFLGIVVLLGRVTTAAHTKSAKSLYEAAQAAETKDDVLVAYEDYAQAFKLDPKNLRYKAAWERVRFIAASVHVSNGERLLKQGNDTEAMTEFLRALEIDPSNELARQDIEAAKRKLSTPTANQNTENADQAGTLRGLDAPVRLKPVSNDPITLHMTEDSKIVYQTLGKAAGINVLFDLEYTSKRVQVDLANVSLLDALRVLGRVSGTFWHPVTPNTLFVASNTQAKRQELEEEAVQTFYLSNVSQQNDLNDIQTALRNLLANAKLYGVPSQDAIVMRATPDELLLAQKIIQDLDKARPEVVIDVALLEVNRDKTRTIGFSCRAPSACNCSPLTLRVRAPLRQRPAQPPRT